MKKIALLTFTGLLFLAFTSLGQEFYTGASKPDNFQPKVQFEAPTDGPAFTCQPTALDENEPDIPDDGLDVVDGGCNSIPPVFIDINIGDVYCGRTNTYSVAGIPDHRDTDWYRIVLTETTNLHWTSIANCPLDIFIIEDDGNCGLVSLAAMDINIPAGTTGHVSYTCTPGTWYFWVGLPVFSGYASGADYEVTLSTGFFPMPLSNWAIYIGIILIVAFTVYRFRRVFA